MNESKINLLLEEIANEIESVEKENLELYTSAIEIEDEVLSIKTQTESFRVLRRMKGLKSAMEAFKSELKKSGLIIGTSIETSGEQVPADADDFIEPEDLIKPEDLAESFEEPNANNEEDVYLPPYIAEELDMVGDILQELSGDSDDADEPDGFDDINEFGGIDDDLDDINNFDDVSNDIDDMPDMSDDLDETNDFNDIKDLDGGFESEIEEIEEAEPYSEPIMDISQELLFEETSTDSEETFEESIPVFEEISPVFEEPEPIFEEIPPVVFEEPEPVWSAEDISDSIAPQPQPAPVSEKSLPRFEPLGSVSEKPEPIFEALEPAAQESQESEPLFEALKALESISEEPVPRFEAFEPISEKPAPIFEALEPIPEEPESEPEPVFEIPEPEPEPEDDFSGFGISTPDAGIYSNRIPAGFNIFGRRVDVDGWADMLVRVCEILILKNPYTVAQFDKYSDLNPLGNCYFSYNQGEIKNTAKKLSNGLWVEISRTPDDTVVLCKKVLELCGYPRSELEIEFVD